MRPYGRATISPTSPRALGVCDRCGFLYNHHQLRWQYDWRGPQMQNIRELVCQSCYDTPQQNGQRTIILPPDPVPIQNARPEYYVGADNPLSALGGVPNGQRQTLGGQIGTMTEGGGLNAAFDGNTNKPSWMCAMKSVSNSSYNTYVGINWQGAPALITPSSLNSPVITHTISAFTITAPNDATFGSTAYLVQGSPVSGGYAAWTTLSSGNPAGDIGEEIVGTTTLGGRYQFHRVAFLGNGVDPIAVAQVTFTVTDGSSWGQ